MNLLIPVAGKSSRFPGMRPKWLLTNPDGNLMIVDSILGLQFPSIIENIYIIYVREHEEQYKFKEGLIANLNEYYLGNKVKFVELEDFTKDQVETIEMALVRLDNKPFLIKDSDNQFVIDIPNDNSVAFVDLNKTEVSNVAAKSYLECDKYYNITNIVEKQVISNKICCGAYFFKNPEDFLRFSRIDSQNRYISDVVFNAILNGIQFKAIEASGYLDWGTKEEWEKYKSKFKTLFVDIDGTLFENSSEYFNPKIGTTKPIMENIEFLRNMVNSGYTQLILTTARSEKFRDATIQQMLSVNLRFDQLIMNLHHGKRVIVNDFNSTNKFPSCEAINIPRNCNNLKDYL